MHSNIDYIFTHITEVFSVHVTSFSHLVIIHVWMKYFVELLAPKDTCSKIRFKCVRICLVYLIQRLKAHNYYPWQIWVLARLEASNGVFPTACFLLSIPSLSRFLSESQWSPVKLFSPVLLVWWNADSLRRFDRDFTFNGCIGLTLARDLIFCAGEFF